MRKDIGAAGGIVETAGRGASSTTSYLEELIAAANLSEGAPETAT